MTFAISNIHGCYSDFKKMLKLIGFGRKDVMFVLGDTVDIGDSPIELVNDLSYADNIWSVAGEHDRTAFRMLGGYEDMLKSGTTPSPEYVSEMQAWMKNGGKVTFDEFRVLDDDEKEGILDYLGDLPLFEETKIGDKHYIFMNNGINGFVPGTDPDDYDDADFFGGDPVRKMNGFIVVAGQRKDIDSFSEDTVIFRDDGCIAIDCGAGRGGRLACIRLDDGKEFYV